MRRRLAILGLSLASVISSAAQAQDTPQKRALKSLVTAAQGVPAPVPTPVTPGSVAGVEDLQPVAVRIPDTGTELGAGWDLLLNRPTTTKAQCIAGQRSEPSQAIFTSSTDFQSVFDKDSLDKYLSVGGSASYSGFGFGASISTNFVSNTHVAHSHTYILGTATVDLNESDWDPLAADIAVAGLHYTATARHLMSDPSGAKFRAVCGDGYVATIRYGGRIDVLFDQETSELTDANSFSLTAAAHGYGGSVHLSLNTSQQQALFSDRFDARAIQSGGSPQSVIDAASAQAAFKNFVQSAPGTFGP